MPITSTPKEPVITEALSLQRTDEAPPGGWQYLQAETGLKFSSVVYDDLFAQVHAHRAAMKLPIPADWKQEVLRQMCGRLPKGWCLGGPAPTPPSPEDRRVVFDAAVKTRMASGLTPLSFGAYESFRHNVCLTCNNFRGEHGVGLIGCAACGCTHLKAWAVETECPNVKLGKEPRWLDSPAPLPPATVQAPIVKKSKSPSKKSGTVAGGKQ